MMSCQFLYLLLFLLICRSQAKKFPSYIEKCHERDPQVRFCYIKAVEKLKNHFSTGIREFGLPSLDPLTVPVISLDDDKNFRATFTNIKIYDIKSVLIKNIDFDYDNSIIKMSLFFPKLRIKSTYNIQGRLLFLQLEGNGPADGNLTNVGIEFDLSGHRYKKNGVEYLKFSALEMKEEFANKPVFRFEGLFKNNPELTEHTNKIVNENIEEIIKELTPAIHSAVNQTVIGMTSYLFSTFPFRELFPK